MGDEDTPNLTLAAEADPIELERQRALSELGWPTREMAANLIRIMRGAGRPALLPQQIIDLSEAILSVDVRAWAVGSAMEITLQSALPGGLNSSEVEEYRGTIVSGALQVTASRLVGQRAQEAAGRREIDQGIKWLEQRKERERERWQADAAQLRAEQRRARKPHKRAPLKPSRTASPPSATDPGDKPQEPPGPAPKSTAEFMKDRQKQLRERAAGDQNDRDA